MELGKVLAPVIHGFNGGIVALTKAPWIGPRVSRYITEITYVGRKSGRTITTPIGYTRSGDDVTIAVSMPEQKSWWRNFLGDGGPITITLDGVARTGHAVTQRDDKGVRVQIRLDPATSA
ncbi:nitroreductase/quinone reductase family protein [Nocardia sp. BMG111209]|uniref:nitroreductase/quinone reductase family protein n=1 Tax=Nocardia sp. BMG111209 TaxID=1160137 RepID=UPI00039A345D|nr:nitroreductase/quinone reductase family protein [Nocardia sp. BMG111209]